MEEKDKMIDNSETIKTTKKGKQKVSFKESFFSWVKTIILAFVLYGIVSIFGFTARVDGVSMVPSFSHGNFLIAGRQYLYGAPERGSIVVFESDNLNEALIKRVIGLPGEVVKLSGGKVFIDGKLMEEPYINNLPLEELEYTVPEGCYFVMGDNRQHSLDSRFAKIGAVPFNKILGTIKIRVFPTPTLF